MKSSSGNKTDKTLELLYLASLTEDFQKMIKDYRASFGIPGGGFSTESNKRKWILQRDKPLDKLLATGKITDKDEPINLADYYYGQGLILNQFKIPPTPKAMSLVESYILNNKLPDKVSLSEANQPFLDLHLPSEEERQRFSRPYADLMIFAGASQEDAINYLKENWDVIKGIWKLQGHDPERIRKRKNKERDKIIFDLYQKSRDELTLKWGEYKESKIAKIMIEKYEIHITPEQVRKIASDQRKLRGL